MPLFRAPFLYYDMGHTFSPSFAVADVNGDGHPDLVAVSEPFGFNGFTVRLGNGDGTFGPRIDHDLQDGFSQSLVVADLDQDTKPDVAVAVSSSVMIRFGNGDGTFRPGAQVLAQYGPDFIAAADLNGDMRQDLVFRREVAYQVYTVSVMLGMGNGAFGPIVDFVLSGSEAPQGLSIGDLNGDDHQDVVVPTRDSPLKILLGNGDGTFAPETVDESYLGRIYGRPLVLSDLNHDDRLDAIIPAFPDTLLVLLGQGDGYFGSATAFEAGPSANVAVVGDMDSDGHADVAITNETERTVSVLRGFGDGTFGPHTEFPGGGGTPALADLNHDDIPDLALRNDFNSISILLGNGDTTFGSGLEFPEPEFYFNFITTTDLNDDTRSDLLVSGYYYIGIYLGNGDGTFVRRSVVTEPGPGGTEAIAVGDFDEDHRKDLAISTGGYGVRIQFGNGDGTFNAGPLLALSDYPRTLAVVDLNGDSHDDIAVPVYYGNLVSVFLGNGDGTFGSRHDYATGFYPTAVAAGDLNGDNLPDLVVTNETATVSVLLNDGAGTFGGHTNYTASGAEQTALVLARLNPDAALDLVVAGNGIHVLLGNGDGSFGPATRYPGGGDPRSFVVMDLNGDGPLDIATTGGRIFIHLGNGDGTFGPEQVYGTAGSVSVAAADFDGSGYVDLAGANYPVSSVSVLLNTTIPGGGAPDCSRATATIADLWPPNHQMVRVSIVGVTDSDGDPVSITITGVTQDEPINGLGDGDTCPDAQLDGGDVLLRAERSGLGKGRVYRVSFTASDSRGGECPGAVTVCVPHNRSASGRVCVDDGQTVDSLGRCGGRRSGGNIRVQLPTAQSEKVVIQYSLAEGGFVDLVIYDVTGRRVATLVKQRQTAGSHQVGWNGARFPAGVYFARLRTDDRIETQSVVLVK